MITEKDLDDLIRNPMIQHVVAKSRPFAAHEVHLPAVVSNAADDRSEKALAFWIVVQIKTFLKERGAASHPMIEKVWKCAGGNTDVDIRVGTHGGYEKFKIKTSMSGPTSFHLKIVTWNGNGKEDCEWERFGAYRGNANGGAIETLPTR
jgi:hypothetical protein